MSQAIGLPRVPVANWRGLLGPLFIVMILAMMVLPLPPFALDLLFTFNIAMALMVMIVAAYMVRPLDFSAFPTVILLTTLLRLSLNVASARNVKRYSSDDGCCHASARSGTGAGRTDSPRSSNRPVIFPGERTGMWQIAPDDASRRTVAAPSSPEPPVTTT